jgi:hypothetical protein
MTQIDLGLEAAYQDPDTDEILLWRDSAGRIWEDPADYQNYLEAVIEEAEQEQAAQFAELGEPQYLRASDYAVQDDEEDFDQEVADGLAAEEYKLGRGLTTSEIKRYAEHSYGTGEEPERSDYKPYQLDRTEDRRAYMTELLKEGIEQEKEEQQQGGGEEE